MNGGYNELMFEDKAGGELLHMRAEKDMTTRVNHDQSLSIGRHRMESVVGNDSESINGNQAHNVDGTKQSTVGQDEMSSILGNLIHLTGADRVLQTVGNSVSQAATHAISSDQGTTLTVGSSMIHIGPDSITIQSPKLLLNPGDSGGA